MKKRILGLVLALCMIIGLLPLTALADDSATSTLTVTTGDNTTPVQWTPSLSKGMAPAYAKTTAEGLVTETGASATDYNLMVEWETSKDPVLTLNGATLNNNTHHMADADPSVRHTIRIGGSEAFTIVLKGTNTINGNLAQKEAGTSDVANHRMAAGIYAVNKGALTIKSVDKTADTLLIDNNGGNCIYKEYDALTIDSANVTLYMETTAKNGQNAIAMVTGGTAYADKTNLTVIDSILEVKGVGRYLGNNFIIMGTAGAGYNSANTGDVLFKNSKIVLNRNNGSSANSSDAEAIRISPNGSFTIDRCDIEAYGNHRTVKYVPTFVNCKDIQFRTSWSTWSSDPIAPGTALTSNTNNSAFKATHICGSETDDGDCTTATTCDMCGQPVAAQPEHAGTDDGDCTTVVMCENPGCTKVAVAAAASHTPATDDGDCTTAITCSVCGTETTPGAAAHTPNADDGDCTTDITCSVCGTVTAPGATSHTPAADDGDCTTAITCSVCGTVTTPAATSHTPNADDGDCTTAITCSICGTETTPAATDHTPNADDGDCTTAITCSTCGTVTTPAEASHTGGTATCKDKAKCTKCGKEYGELRATHDPAQRTDCAADTMCTTCGQVAIPAGTHVPEADDGDCTTAIKCSVCGTETTPAAANHTPAADDGDCTTAITCSVCGTETTPATTHTGGTATCKDKAKCTNCGKEYGALLTTHVPNADDGDCTTEVICSICDAVTTPAATHTGGTATCKEKAKCTTCAKEYGELLTTHVPAADDGDCTTAVKCSICGTETTAAKAAHTPAADDGDCTTAIKCTDCDKVTTAAATHTGGTATCKAKAKCATCGKEYGELAAHTPAADDGDCTTAIKCTVCEAETTAAATHTGGTATCKAKAKCATCGKEYGELAAHTPAADDGDCTTAIKCTVCEAETTVAKTGHTYANDKDTTCDDPGCKVTRTVTDNPKTGDNTLTMLLVTMAVSVAGLMAMAYAFIYNKKGNNY